MGEASCAAPVPDVGASAVGIEDGVQRRRECNEVTVVDAAVLQLRPSSMRSGPQSRRVGAIGVGISTRRSTTWTAERPDTAARACSQARWRQVTEHHCGIGPRDRGLVTPPHQAQDVAAARRALPSATAGVDSRGVVGTFLASSRSGRWRRWRSRSRRVQRPTGTGQSQAVHLDGGRAAALTSSAARRATADGSTRTGAAQVLAMDGHHRITRLGPGGDHRRQHVGAPGRSPQRPHATQDVRERELHDLLVSESRNPRSGA